MLPHDRLDLQRKGQKAPCFSGGMNGLTLQNIRDGLCLWKEQNP